MEHFLLRLTDWRWTNKRHIQIFTVILSAIYALMLAYTPHPFGLMTEDSMGYVNFSAIRTAPYHLFLSACTALGLSFTDITLVQCGLYVLVLGCVFYVLAHLRVPIFLLLILYISLLGNIYLNGFHFSILTESIGFSLTLLILLYLQTVIKDFSPRNILILSFLVGLIFTTKPASFPYVIGLLITVILIGKRNKFALKKALIFVSLPIITLISIEYVLHKMHHDQSRSLMPTHLYGKAAIMSTMDTKPELPETIASDPALATAWTKYQDGVQQHMRKIAKEEHQCLSIARYSNYENYAYWHLGTQETQKLLKTSGISEAKWKIGLWKDVALKHPERVAQLAALHYLNFFCVGTPIKNIENQTKAPLLSDIDPSYKHHPSVIFWAFMVFGALLTLITVYYIGATLVSLLKHKKLCFNDNDFLAVNLILWSQGYLAFIAIFSITGPRYFMLVYPFMIYAIGLCLIERIKAVLSRSASKKEALGS